MKISEVERFVGLSKKAIRLYESRGLLTVARISNGYREYSDEDIEALRQIKLLRLAGISISDIKLFRHGILPMEELLDKRKKEMDREYGEHSAQYDFCKTLLRQLDGGIVDCTYRLEETEETVEPCGELSVGIDIGTTTIDATVIDHASKQQIEGFSMSNTFDLPSKSGFCEQDANGIVKRVKELLDHIIGSYENIRSIGVTGQMHGILYTDKHGNAVSPLFTWKDKRADQKNKNGKTYCEIIQSITGEEISTGYGFATHYYNQEHGLIPADTSTFCSIMDYFVMKLTKKYEPLVHATNAASFGFYDVLAARFKTEKLEMLFSDTVTVPSVTDEFAIAGEYKGIPVAVAIGDNQASFLGSVQELEDSALVNIGTGSQISMLSNGEYFGSDLELRPFFAGSYLLCGAALCGGSAYAMLERFFREYNMLSDGKNPPQYATMNRIAEEAYAKGVLPLAVDTAFCGTRSNPARRGSISAIDTEAFTPASLILGVIHGMCRELYDLYRETSMKKKRIVAAGGAVQKNTVLQRVIADMFGSEPVITRRTDEAATGAALFSAVATGVISNIEAIAEYITYKEKNNNEC